MPARKPSRNRSSPKLRLVFEESPQPMCVFDRETLQFLKVNRAALAQYGYDENTFLTMRLSDLQDPEELPRLMQMLRSVDSGAHPLGVWRHSTRAGKVIDVEMAVHDIGYDGRKATLAVLLDVTERRLLETQLRQAQKMEAVGMLAGGIAHDFNNLLTIITGYSQLVLNNLPDHDVNRGSIEQIMKAGERAAALTRQLLAFSRRQVLQPKILEINQLVSGLAAMLRRVIGEDVDLRLNLAPEAGRVNADPGQLEQVIMNLAVNARDAMPNGGILTIETHNTALDEAYANSHIAVQPGLYVLIAVSDTGVGMDADTRAHLFEPFFTTKAQGRGTGLGLSIVFGIIKQSGGNIEVYSEPGHGTSVKVYMPRVVESAATGPESITARARGGTETILLVEDEEMVRTLVRQTLEREGYKVIDAGSAEQALRLAAEFRDPIHLMITDVVMPKLNGRELANRMGRVRPQIKVLYMSGYTDNAVVSSGVVENSMPFLQKPFTPEALAGKVRQVLEADISRHAGR